MKNMISRRNFLAAAGVVAAAGVLTACGGSSSTAASAAGSTAAAASGDTIKVGVMGPLSGNVSVYGQAVVNGAALYLKQVNANGGINGKQIEILTEDEQGDATQAVNCFTKMVDEGMTALIGDVTTTPTLAVVAESADYNMPMVTASATAEAVTYDAETDTVNANVFRATFTDPFQGIKMADYAYQKLGYTKAAVIFKKGADYNEGLAENFATRILLIRRTTVFCCCTLSLRSFRKRNFHQHTVGVRQNLVRNLQRHLQLHIAGNIRQHNRSRLNLLNIAQNRRFRRQLHRGRR